MITETDTVAQLARAAAACLEMTFGTIQAKLVGGRAVDVAPTYSQNFEDLGDTPATKTPSPPTADQVATVKRIMAAAATRYQLQDGTLLVKIHNGVAVRVEVGY